MCADGMIVYIRGRKYCTRMLEMINTFSKGQDIKLIYKINILLHTSSKCAKKGNHRNMPIDSIFKESKQKWERTGINLTKKVKDLFSEFFFNFLINKGRKSLENGKTSNIHGLVELSV